MLNFNEYNSKNAVTKRKMKPLFKKSRKKNSIEKTNGILEGIGKSGRF